MFTLQNLTLFVCCFSAASATPITRQANGTEYASCATSTAKGCTCEGHLESRKAHNKAWDDLSSSTRANLEALGHSENSWTTCHFSVKKKSDCPSAWMVKYEDLTPVQQEAVTGLGAPPAVWNDRGMLAQKCGVYQWSQCQKFNKNELRYNVDWSDIAPADIPVLENLGWTKTLWGSCDTKNVTSTTCPASELKDWAELTPEEQTEIQFLGYTQDTWDNLLEWQSECKVEEFISCVNMFDIETRLWVDWEALSNDEKAYLTALGWDSTYWERCDLAEPQEALCPSSRFKMWTDLTEEEKAGASGIGYTMESWDNFEAAAAVCKYTSVKMCYNVVNVALHLATTGWEGLSESERESCAILFYNGTATNVQPTTCMPADYEFTKAWNELTPAEQAAAESLGLTQQTVDMRGHLANKCNLQAAQNCHMAGNWPGTVKCSPTSLFYVN